jgi:DNA-binding MarR family transcriptional regulator
MTEPIEPMDLENHVFFLCTQVVFRRDRALNEALKPLDLASTEYRTLSAILRKGPLSMQELAQWTAYERTRLTHLLNSMEAREWITRAPSASDKRTVLVQIAPKGTALFKKAKRIVDQLTDEVLRGNTAEEIDQLRRTLRTMRATLIALEQG